jgi:hypothetical protein
MFFAALLVACFLRRGILFLWAKFADSFALLSPDLHLMFLGFRLVSSLSATLKLQHAWYNAHRRSSVEMILAFGGRVCWSKRVESKFETVKEI